MKKINFKLIFAAFGLLATVSCGKDFLTLDPKGQKLESGFYKSEAEIFEGLVAAYDPMQWGTGGSWCMTLGLSNTFSDDTYAGGSDASDQPAWVACDKFTLDATLGPQKSIWANIYSGVYRANLILEKIEGNVPDLKPANKARFIAEAKFLRAYYYFELVRMFGNVPLITGALGADNIYKQVQATPAAVYAQIEKDLKDAVGTAQLPESLPVEELGRITKNAARALYGKAILYQNNNARMSEAAAQFEDVIKSNLYTLEPTYANIFKPDNKFGRESIFEIVHSGNRRGGYEFFAVNGNEGNANVQFFGMRDYVGPTFATGWSFCPVTEDLAAFMKNDPRFASTIIDGKDLKSKGASYTAGYQNTDFFIRKYGPIQTLKATSGEPALNWAYNVKEIRLADVYLMAAEALQRGGGDETKAKTYLNAVRKRVGLADKTSSGAALLDDIYNERRMELATEGHRFWDLVRTGKAPSVLGNQGFKAGKNEIFPIPQAEIDITSGVIKQNAGY